MKREARESIAATYLDAPCCDQRRTRAARQESEQRQPETRDHRRYTKNQMLHSGRSRKLWSGALAVVVLVFVVVAVVAVAVAAPALVMIKWTPYQLLCLY